MQAERQHYTAAQVYKRLLGYVKPYWVVFLVAIVATMASSGVDAGLAYIFKPLLDKGFIAKDQHFLTLFPIVVIGIFIFRGVASFFASYCLAWVARMVVMLFRQQLFSHILVLPARYFDANSSGEILSKLVYNVEQVAKASTNALTVLVRETCFIVGLFVVMALVSWQLTLLFLLVTPLVFGIVKLSSRRMRGLSHRIQDRMGEVSHVAEEAVEAYREVRIFGGQHYENQRFQTATQRNRRSEMKVVITDSLSTSGVQLVVASMLAILVYLATHNGAQSNITAGGFTSFIASIIMLLKPMKNLTTVNSVIQKGVAGAESVFAMLDVPAEIDKGRHRLDQKVRGQVDL